LLFLLDIKKIRHLHGLTQTQFADRLGLNLRTIQNYESGTDIPLNIQKLIEYEFVSYKKENILQEPDTSYLRRKQIPLIPIEAIAGNGSGSVAILEEDIQERYIIPEFSGADFMILVKGSSMYPKYNSGDVVACKFITDKTFFQWGRVYVLHHKEQGAMIKRLFPTENASIIELRSDNEKYPAFRLPIKSINNFALVIGVVRLE
jgi:repressor LexA